MKKLLSIGVATWLLAAGVANAQSVHSVSYSARTAALGTAVNLGGRDYVLVRLPLKDFGSTDRYIVEFLAGAFPPSANLVGVLTTEHSNETLTNTISISGFPASVQVGDGRFHSILGDSGDNSASALAAAFGSVRIKVGATLITFAPGSSVVQQAPTATLPTAPYSGSANAPWGNYVDPLAQVTAIDNWIDYIRIVRVN